jgi:hypothetical protein
MEQAVGLNRMKLNLSQVFKTITNQLFQLKRTPDAVYATPRDKSNCGILELDQHVFISSTISIKSTIISYIVMMIRWYILAGN